MNTITFTDYIIEQDEKPEVQTTEHMFHVGDVLYSGAPTDAIDHTRAMFNRFNGLHTVDHEGFVKVDGSFSALLGSDKDGRRWVGYKSGKERFYDHDAIAATGKEHYVEKLGPALDAVNSMDNLPDGVAIQGDILHTPEHTERTYRANPTGIVYKTNPQARGKFAIAAHSQYEVKGKDLIRTSNTPDPELFKSSRVHAPELSLTDKKFNVSPYRKDSIAQHLTKAEEIMGDETTQAFARSIPEDKNFHKLIQGYSNLIARTTGRRSVEDFRGFVSDYVGRNRPESTREKWTTKHMEYINNNSTQLDNVFTAHHHLNHAKHHLLDILGAHQGDYEIVPHGGDEHEGLVSHMKDKVSAKFVREGPGGFPAKNAAGTARRVGVPASAPLPPV